MLNPVEELTTAPSYLSSYNPNHSHFILLYRVLLYAEMQILFGLLRFEN